MTLPPLILALVGLLHPMMLTMATSQRWTVLHVALIPVFPLLGLSLWLLLRDERGALPALARVAVYVYACFYTALDTVNGVAVGILVRRRRRSSTIGRPCARSWPSATRSLSSGPAPTCSPPSRPPCSSSGATGARPGWVRC